MTERELLEREFGAADPEHYHWQTQAVGVAERERALVRSAFLPVGDRLLDLGCGEGATLHHLGAPAGAVGVDLFEAKLAFARQQLPACRFVAASVEDLPFADGSFDHVIVRDVIHHVDDPGPMLNEILRVLDPRGRLDILEPCGANPLIALHALTNPAERGELRSSLRYLRGLLRSRFRVESVHRRQALPVHRVVYHPGFGWPALAEHRFGRAVVGTLERIAEQVMPRPAYAYVHLRARPRP